MKNMFLKEILKYDARNVEVRDFSKMSICIVSCVLVWSDMKFYNFE